jgi:hypothetical protein
MMSKGAQWLKIDMHYKESTFCESQGISDPDGCFILLHDSPSMDVRYNTSIDVINYIQSHQRYFYNPEFTVYIALCFKSTPLKICGADGAPFMRLLQRFKSQTESLVASGANIEFVIDGSLVMIFSCTMDAFRPWVSTWQGMPVEAFFNDNATLGYDRLQVFDLPAVFSAIYATEQLNWGKFASGKWPLLIWEPSDEAELVTFTKLFLDWAASHPDFPDPLPNYRFAINIDPVQFQVYTGSATGRSWRNLISVAGTHPKVTAIPYQPPQSRLGPSANKFNVYLTSQDGIEVHTKQHSAFVRSSAAPYPLTFISFHQENGIPSYAILGAKELQGSITVLRPVVPLPASSNMGPISSASTTLFPPQTPGLVESKYSTPVVALSSQSHGTVNFYALADNVLQPLLSWTPSDLATLSVVSWITSTNSSRAPILARLVATESNLQSTMRSFAQRMTGSTSPLCSWYLELWQLLSLSQPAPKRLQSICLSGLPSFSRDSAELPSLSIAGYMDGDGDGEGVLTVTFQGEVLASYFSFTNSTDRAPIISVSRSSTIGVGTNSSISITWDQDNLVPYAHEVHTNGFCWNTEVRNKQSATTVCDQIPVSTPSVMNYNYAPLSHWKAYLTSNKVQPLTACSDFILHGTYDQGRNPSVALTSIGSRIGVLEVHEGWRTGDHDVSECGAPLVLSANGGIVLDSWPLAEPLWV